MGDISSTKFFGENKRHGPIPKTKTTCLPHTMKQEKAQSEPKRTFGCNQIIISCLSFAHA